MPGELFPIAATAMSVKEPETAYGEEMFWFSMSPRVEGATVDACFSLLVKPFRRLKDGTIEVAPESMHRSYAVGGASERLADSTLVKGLLGLLAAYAAPKVAK